MKFDYYQIPTGSPDRPYKYLPLIPLKIFGAQRGKFLLGEALLDSGAEKSLFDMEIAKELGISLGGAAAEAFSGVEGFLLASWMSSF